MTCSVRLRASVSVKCCSKCFVHALKRAVCVQVNKPEKASCEDPFGCTGPDQCFGAGCGLIGIDGKLGPCECNKLNGVFQNTDDAFCRSEDNYADAYSCTDEACKPADAGGEATGCVTTVSTVVECSDQFACTADACYVDVQSTPACSGTSVLDCIQTDTGCVFKTQDDVCKCATYPLVSD